MESKLNSVVQPTRLWLQKQFALHAQLPFTGDGTRQVVWGYISGQWDKWLLYLLSESWKQIFSILGHTSCRSYSGWFKQSEKWKYPPMTSCASHKPLIRCRCEVEKTKGCFYLLSVYSPKVKSRLIAFHKTVLIIDDENTFPFTWSLVCKYGSFIALVFNFLLYLLVYKKNSKYWNWYL